MKPRVLILYYSFTHQTRHVAEAMGDVFRERDWDVDLCNIEFADEHYRIELPFRPVIPKLLRWLVPQVLGKSGEIRIPEEILQGDYDLICLGSPTWWLNPAMPVVSFLNSSSAQRIVGGKTDRRVRCLPQVLVEQHAASKETGAEAGCKVRGRSRFLFPGKPGAIGVIVHQLHAARCES